MKFKLSMNIEIGVIKGRVMLKSFKLPSYVINVVIFLLNEEDKFHAQLS